MTGGNLAALLGLDQVPYRMKQTNQRKKDTGEKKNLVGGEGTRKRKFMQCLQRDNDPATIKRMLSDPGEMTTRALRTNKKRNLTQKKKKKKKDVYVDRPRRGNRESGTTTSFAGFLTTKERNERCQSSPKPKTEHCIQPFPPFLERKEKS